MFLTYYEFIINPVGRQFFRIARFSSRGSGGSILGFCAGSL